MTELQFFLFPPCKEGILIKSEKGKERKEISTLNFS